MKTSPTRLLAEWPPEFLDELIDWFEKREESERAAQRQAELRKRLG